jgi:phosphatidylserine/phosphatidylglycerophosphate/cardiolipin synthase-like enzyme
MFHPVDPTLDAVAAEIGRARANIDIAMYSMDVSDESPVIKAFKDHAFQEKLKAGSMRVRLIFEGYGSDEDNEARSKALENLGIDVRWFSGGRKVHHKFAVIDSDSNHAALVTGSANWSLGL